MWRRLTFLLALGLAASDGSGPQPTPTGPTPQTPAAPTLPPPAVPVPSQAQVEGTVIDTASRSVEGATIEILDGPQAELSTSTNASGEFSFRFEGTVLGAMRSTGRLIR